MLAVLLASDRGSTMPAPATVWANGDRGGSTSGRLDRRRLLRPDDVRDRERQRRHGDQRDDELLPHDSNPPLSRKRLFVSYSAGVVTRSTRPSLITTIRSPNS